MTQIDNMDWMDGVYVHLMISGTPKEADTLGVHGEDCPKSLPLPGLGSWGMRYWKPDANGQAFLGISSGHAWAHGTHLSEASGGADLGVYEVTVQDMMRDMVLQGFHWVWKAGWREVHVESGHEMMKFLTASLCRIQDIPLTGVEMTDDDWGRYDRVQDDLKAGLEVGNQFGLSMRLGSDWGLDPATETEKEVQKATKSALENEKEKEQ